MSAVSVVARGTLGIATFCGVAIRRSDVRRACVMVLGGPTGISGPYTRFPCTGASVSVPLRVEYPDRELEPEDDEGGGGREEVVVDEEEDGN